MSTEAVTGTGSLLGLQYLFEACLPVRLDSTLVHARVRMSAVAVVSVVDVVAAA